ncbi:MAG: rRNA pseudouridine synthase [Planctomycetes bacterium]|nr:rRNA pseudouridine synthase [Planctomycetota bacterium]
MPTPPRRGPAPARKDLVRLLLRYGVGSRAQARELVLAGRVRVDGRVCTDPHERFDERSRIEIDGQRAEQPERVVVMLNKPVGCLTTARDPAGRPTVFAYLAGAPSGLRAVGRLDLDTSGLLLFTNDTLLAARISDPSSHVAKHYEVRTRARLSDTQLAELRTGVQLSDGPARALRVERCIGAQRGRWIELSLDEGRNREVRRMVHTVGGDVRELRRVAIGALRLDDLQSGQWRALAESELQLLGLPAPARRGGAAPPLR